METHPFDITIIGAGVVGLAVAEELSRHFKGILLLEKNESHGQETSSRNSEVIHAGIYYPEGSLKASLCVEGRKLLYEACEKRGHSPQPDRQAHRRHQSGRGGGPSGASGESRAKRGR